MKKSLFLIPLALGLFACSNDNLGEGPNTPGATADGDVSYLSVSLSTVTGTGTRDNNDPKHPYKDGLEEEYAANSVVFYFFDQYLNTVKVVNGTQYYYQPSSSEINSSLTEGVPDNNFDDTNITAEIGAMIVLTNSGTNTSAYYIAALVNQTTPYEGIENYDQFLKKTEEEGNLHVAETNFLMSTSSFVATEMPENTNPESDTYNQKDYQKPGLVYIYDKVQPTRDLAINNPATIYVERMAAKVSMKSNFNESSTVGDYTFVPVLDSDGAKITFNKTTGDVTEQKTVYLKLLGWNVTAIADKSYTTKKLESEFNDTYLWNGWNNTTDHRSYWASNPKVSFLYGSFNNDAESYKYSPALALKSFADGEDDHNYTYLPENAFDPNAADVAYEPVSGTVPTTTKIIVAGQLMDGNNADAQPVNYSEYAGYSYYSEDDLKVAMANASNVYLRVKSVTTDAETGQPVTSYEFIPLVKVEKFSGTGLVSYQNVDEDLQSSILDKVKNKYYYTFYQFTESVEENKKVKYPTYEGAEEGGVGQLAGEENGIFVVGKTTDPIEVGKQKVLHNIDEFNAYMLEFAGPAKVWHTGYNYYFLDIKHLNTGATVADPKETLNGLEEGATAPTYPRGYYGVVRNHWYETTVSAVYGFGTPVFDPDDVIYPQTPDDDPWTYIAAKIEILSWHKVINNEVLGKK